MNGDGRTEKQDMVAEIKTIRRLAIEDAVIAVITRKGLEALTVQDVADELGIAKGTLYLYFASRDEMIAATARDVRRRLARELTPMFLHSSVEECLTKLILHLSQLPEGSRRVLTAISKDQCEEDSPDEWGWKWNRARLQRLFANARRRNEIGDIASGALATFVADYLEGLVLRGESRSRSSTHKAGTPTLIAVMLHGVAAIRNE